MQEPARGDPSGTLELRSTTDDGSGRAPASLQVLLGQLGKCPRGSLLSILRADQRKRWKRGERVPAEVYLNHLPEMPDRDEAAVDIIFSEIALREEAGQSPGQEEYVRRFPQYESLLRRQFMLNALLDSSSLVESAGSSTLAGSPSTEQSPGATVEFSRTDNLVAGDDGNPATTLDIRDRTAAGIGAEPVRTGPPPVPLPSVPGYEIIEVLGRGGMGVVYKARQTKLKRLVALKMILAGSHASPQDLQRMRSEAEAVARVQHPNIVQIYEVGEHEGLPFLSLEYVEGGSLADKLDGTPLTGAQAGLIVERLAQAMHYAHLQGIIHRDLKPANVLLAPPRSPDSTITSGELAFGVIDAQIGMPKITDFGLAKTMEGGSGLTHSGAIVGTPSYMAPEQASGQVHSISPRTDVYALGAILYELLTGRPPFRAANPFDTILQVLSQDPVPPSQLEPKVPRDLENICLKCLQKDPARRYSTALALAEDLAAFREHRPVTARPVGWWERAVKWARRRPAVAGLLAVILLISVVAFVLVTWQWQVAENAYETAQVALEETEQARRLEHQQRVERDLALVQAKHSLYFNRIALAERDWFANDVVGVQKLLAAAPTDLRHWEWHYLNRLSRGGEKSLSGKECVAISADDRQIVSARGSTITVWDLATRKEILNLEGHRSRVNHLAYSPDSQQLASASDDGTVKLWDAITGRVLRTLGESKSGDILPPLRHVAFSPDGTLVAAASDDEAVLVWDAKSGKEIRVLLGHTSQVTAVAFSPDSKRLASSSRDQTVKLWDTKSWENQRTLRSHRGAVHTVAFDPKGIYLASGADDHLVKVWDADSGQELLTLRGHDSPVHAVAFGPDGKLASASGGLLRPGEIKTWNPQTGEALFTYRWATQEITGLAFSRSGKLLASADRERVVVWDATNDLESRLLNGHTEGVMAVAFAPNGKQPLLASAGEDWMLKVWDPSSEQLIHDCAGHTEAINAVAWTSDGGRLITASDDKTIKVWDAKTGLLVQTLRGHTTGVLSIALSPGGRFLASAACQPGRADPKLGGEVKIWDLAAGTEMMTIHVPWVRTLAYSPNGLYLAGGAERPYRVILWHAGSGKEARSLTGPIQWVSAVAFSPDGRLLAASGGSINEGLVKLWDTATFTERPPIRTRTGRVGSIAFSPDSKRLAAASWDHTLKLFDPWTGQDVLTLRGHRDWISGVAFSPDGGWIASSSRDKTVRLWNGMPGNNEEPVPADKQ